MGAGGRWDGRVGLGSVCTGQPLEKTMYIRAGPPRRGPSPRGAPDRVHGLIVHCFPPASLGCSAP